MLRSATRHERTQALLQRSALAHLRRLRGGPVGAQVSALTTWQALAAVQAGRAVDAMLDEQGIDAPLAAPVVTAAQVGTASNGRPLAWLLGGAASREVTRWQFDRIVATQLQDVARSMLATSIAARPKIDGYVRQIQPGACSRCAILAGRFYRWNEGFDRHPNCNCEHVGTTREAAAELAQSPQEYFDGLSAEEQDRIFTKAGAEAIRLGADPARVVNVRAGMSRAQPIATNTVQREVFRLEVPGAPTYTVRNEFSDVVEGSNRLARNPQGLYTTSVGTGQRRTRERLNLDPYGGVRLMPESILEISNGDRERALTMLRDHGYIR